MEKNKKVITLVKLRDLIFYTVKLENVCAFQFKGPSKLKFISPSHF